MSDTAIQAENLGKLYRVGQFVGYMTLRESLMKVVFAPFRRSRRAGGGRQETVLRPPGSQSQVPGQGNYIWALKDVSLEVKQGEAVGIIGRNGAGKTTLLRVLCRITEPTEGYAEIYGRVGSLLEVGTGFHPELTGRENTYLNGAVLGMKKREIDRKFDEIVEFAGVGKFINTPLKRYSSGMQVRLAFSVAAHLETEILLVDEVLAVGDAAFQKKCLGKMGDVTREGRTVLFVSHNMAAIQSLCQRAFLMDSGHLVHTGPTTEVVQEYLSSSTEGEKSHTSLAERRDRRGNGRLRFTRIYFEDMQGERRTTFQSGEDIRIILEYTVPSKERLKNILVTFCIDSIWGYRISLLQNDYVGSHFPDIGPTGRFICQLSRLPLSIGTYKFTVAATVNGAIADWIIDAGSFSVIAGDFYGYGKHPAQHDGPLLMQHTWEYSEEQDGKGPT